jgi:hypothetical protein
MPLICKLILQLLGPEVLASVTSSVHSDSVILSCIIWILVAHQAVIMASEDRRMSKQGAAVRQKPEKLEITRSLKGGKSCRIIMVACNIGL